MLNDDRREVRQMIDNAVSGIKPGSAEVDDEKIKALNGAIIDLSERIDSLEQIIAKAQEGKKK